MHYDLKLDIEPTTSLDEILNFITRYWYKWAFNFSHLSIDDNLGFQNWDSLDFLKSLLHLHLESAIDFEIQWWVQNTRGIKNKKIDSFLKDKIRVENWLLSVFANRNWYKFYDIYSIELHFDYLRQNIKPYDYLSYSINLKWYQFFTLLFCKIHHELWYKNIDTNTVAKDLYNYIYEQTNHKNNHLWTIKIFYPFYKNYLNDNRLVFPLLSELENDLYIKIKDIEILDEFIYFEIERINHISEKLMCKIASKIPDKWNNTIVAKYIDDSILINWKEIYFKTKNTKIYNLYKIMFDCFEKNKTNKVSYWELITLLARFPQKYPKLKKEYFLDYDQKIRKDIQEKNKNIQIVDDFIGIDKSWIYCDYYIPETQ